MLEELHLIRMPVSPGWRVPRSWARFGYVRYCALFGWSMGLGVLVARPTLALYGLFAWALIEPSVLLVITVFGVYALARTVPVVFVIARIRDGQSHPLERVEELRPIMVASSCLRPAILLAVAANAIGVI